MVYPAQRQLLQQNFARAQVLNRSGRTDEAVRVLGMVLEMDPNFIPALHMKGRLALMNRDAVAAVRLLSRAVRLAPDQPPLLNDFAVALAMTDDVRRAADIFRRLIKLQPDNPDGYRNLSLFLISNKLYQDALPVLQQASARWPGNADTCALLSVTYYYTGQLSEALAEHEKAVAADPNMSAPYETLGLIRLQQGRVEEAIVAFDAALARDPNLASSLGNKGQALASLGRFDEARAALKGALDMSPDATLYLSSLINLGRIKPDDDRLPYLKRAEVRLTNLSEDAQIELHMALAKAGDDLGHPADAMAHWDAANALCRKNSDYNEAAELGQLQDIAAVFSSDFLIRHKGVGAPSDKPVFVVGMPRSGTSLVEQILASHPDVYGAGESNFWNHKTERGDLGADFPAHVADLSGEDWRKAGVSYLTQEEKTAPGMARVIDKMPNNFRWLGAVHIALPGAKFIHVHRNPEDCALSCYSKNFICGFRYSYDLAELGRYMRAYESLMAHWRAVLPPECLLEIEYEELVQNFDVVAHRMVAFIGLDWDAHCARFYETERAVVTASNYSVRQPVSTRAIGRAKPYLSWLEPFTRARG